MEKSCFLFKNLSHAEVKSYTGIEKPAFEVMIQIFERFSPFNYWSGKPVVSTSYFGRSTSYFAYETET